jgi:hypothetical protein
MLRTLVTLAVLAPIALAARPALVRPRGIAPQRPSRRSSVHARAVRELARAMREAERLHAA